MKGYRKILVAMNGSRQVLHKGLQLADDEKTWVTVLKVVPPYEGDLNLTGIRNIRDVFDGGAGSAALAIHEVAMNERALVKTRIESGAIHEKIIDVADEERCDLIIMGRPKSRGIMGKLMGGRTVERVVGGAHCPVLVVES